MPAETPRERCACGLAVFTSQGDADRGRRRQQHANKGGAGRLKVYRCDIRPGVWHVGHNGE